MHHVESLPVQSTKRALHDDRPGGRGLAWITTSRHGLTLYPHCPQPPGQRHCRPWPTGTSGAVLQLDPSVRLRDMTSLRMYGESDETADGGPDRWSRHCCGRSLLVPGLQAPSSDLYCPVRCGDHQLPSSAITRKLLYGRFPLLFGHWSVRARRSRFTRSSGGKVSTALIRSDQIDNRVPRPGQCLRTPGSRQTSAHHGYAAMPTTDAFMDFAAIEPSNGALPNENTPPSAPASQYPFPSGAAAIPTIGALRCVPPIEP